jgi:hypothetical protein
MKHLLFIVGVGRSGTSLLQSMFAANEHFNYLAESSFLRRFALKSICAKTYQTKGTVALLNLLENDPPFNRLEQSPKKLLESINTEKSEHLDFDIYYELLKNKTETNWVGDKDPRMIEHLSLLSQLEIDTHVIHIIRDPRDVLVSKKKADWSKKGHVWKHIFANKVQFLLGVKNGPKYFNKNYQEVIYESLTASPEVELKRLCDNTGVVFDATMLNFGRAARELVAKDEINWKKETFGPLLTSNSNKWKTELLPREIKLTELCCKKNFLKGGYLADSNKIRLTLKDKLWVFIGYALVTVFAPIYILFRK